MRCLRSTELIQYVLFLVASRLDEADELLTICVLDERIELSCAHSDQNLGR